MCHMCVHTILNIHFKICTLDTFMKFIWELWMFYRENKISWWNQKTTTTDKQIGSSVLLSLCLHLVSISSPSGLQGEDEQEEDNEEQKKEQEELLGKGMRRAVLESKLRVGHLPAFLYWVLCPFVGALWCRGLCSRLVIRGSWVRIPLGAYSLRHLRHFIQKGLSQPRCSKLVPGRNFFLQMHCVPLGCRG